MNGTILRRAWAGLAAGAVTLAAAGAAWSAGGDWPTFRGPDRTGISPEKGLLKQWPAAGPPLAWKVSGLGDGFTTVAIVGGKIFTTGEKNNEAYVIALSVDGGKKLWETKIGGHFQEGNGGPGPRAGVTVDDGHVYALAAGGELACLTAADGKVVWSKNLKGDFGGGQQGPWGYSEAPAVDGDLVIVSPGGKEASVVALNKKTGETVWKAATGDKAAYCSGVVVDILGVRQYVTILSGQIVGVAVKDGKVLWSHKKSVGGVANVPTPIVKDARVLYSTGYNDGGMVMLSLEKKGDGFAVSETWSKAANELRNHHGGYVLIGDKVYGGHGQNDGKPFCLEWDTGKELWKRDRAPGKGSAAVTAAEGMLYFRYQDGLMVLLDPADSGWTVKGSFKIPDGKKPSWAYPVIHDGKLYLREQDNLFVYNIKK
jgi:outer membrane protein assembly factor BamB